MEKPLTISKFRPMLSIKKGDKQDTPSPPHINNQIHPEIKAQIIKTKKKKKMKMKSDDDLPSACKEPEDCCRVRENTLPKTLDDSVSYSVKEHCFQISCISQQSYQKRRGRPRRSSFTPSRILDCKLCDFNGKDLLDLEIHLKIHSNQNIHECPYCYSTFSQKGNLVTHIRTHTKDRPFKCPLCQFSASQKINLQSHLRTHTKEKPFMCDCCDYSTAQKCNLISHMQRRHNISEHVKYYKYKLEAEEKHSTHSEAC